MELFQFAGEGVRVGGGEFPSRRRREEASSLPARGPRLVTSSPTFHQPSHNIQHVERPAALGDGNILQRFDPLEFSRTSSGVAIKVAQASRLPGDESGCDAAVTAALLCGAIVLTMKIRASGAMRCRSILHPTHPARRAVVASGFPSSLRFDATSRLMTADSENMNDGIRSRSRTSQVARA